MYVLIAAPVGLAGYSYSAGQMAEIPKELYDPNSMTRTGPILSNAQQTALVSWATVAPGWPAPINAE